jgi:hypothetical protein
MQRVTIERARSLVRQYTAVREAAMVEQVATRMVAQGECVWHALSQVTGKACWCSKCAPHCRRLGS